MTEKETVARIVFCSVTAVLMIIFLDEGGGGGRLFIDSGSSRFLVFFH